VSGKAGLKAGLFHFEQAREDLIASVMTLKKRGGRQSYRLWNGKSEGND
jgi:hypothetical protein